MMIKRICFSISLLVIQMASYSQIDAIQSAELDTIKDFTVVNTYFSKDTSYISPVPIDSLIAVGKTYLGLPYRTTVRAPWPLDCSGYVSMLYGFYGVELPHSSGSIAQITKTIPLQDVQAGDMLFFKGSNSNKKNRVGHVALVIEVYDTYVLMMHSTISKGIIIEPYPDGYYYTKRFVKAGRLQ